MKKFLKAEALAHIRANEIHFGIEKYKEYLELNKEDDDAWASLGGAYRRSADIDNALQCYSRAYELNPDSTYALVNLVSLQAARNSFDDQKKLAALVPEAVRLCRETIETDKASFWIWYDLGTLHLIGGNIEEARKIFFYAVTITPETAKENFRSVRSNLLFLQQHNPNISGLAEIIELLNQYAE